MEGVQKARPDVLACVEHEDLRAAVAAVLGEKPSDLLTFDYKWLRGVPRRRFTGAHMDYVYMSRGSSRLLTTWVPMGDTSLEMGGLAMCKGSHRSAGLSRLRETYGSMDQEKEGMQGTGWFTEDPAEVEAVATASSGDDPCQCQWVAGDYRAGDVIMFGMRTLHMSTANLTDKVRISCDVRWQPKGDEVDPRYVGAGAQDVGSRQAAGMRATDAAAAAAAEEAEEKAKEKEEEKEEKSGAVDGGPTLQDMKEKWGLAGFKPEAYNSSWGEPVE